MKLRPEIMEAFDRIREFTDIQKRAFAPISEGKNVLIVSPTGSGKTEAALLPILNDFSAQGGINIIYITPLKALNRDMLKRLSLLGERLGFSVSVRHGDTTQAERNRQRRNPPNLLITTPETLQILLVSPKMREHLRNVAHVVIDEIHDLMESERGIQLSLGLERLSLLANFQRVGISATIGEINEAANFLKGGSENVEIVKSDGIRRYVVGVKPASALRREIDENPGTLMFVNTRHGAELLSSGLPDNVAVHHGSLSKDIRLKAENDFREGRLRALIATSSMELGIDIGSIEHVVQYNSPRQVSRLVQRVGRAKHRVGGVASGTILVTSPEEEIESLATIELMNRRWVEPITVRKNDLATLANQILALTLEYRRIEMKEAYRILRRAYPFWTLGGDDFEGVLRELRGRHLINIREGTIQLRGATRTYFFENISMIPDEQSLDIYDSVTKRKLGSVDSDYASALEIGSRMVMGGRPWDIVERGERIYVARARGIGEIPDWTGEDLPVSYEAAQQVGVLRKRVRDDGKSDDANGFAVPDNTTITIEAWGKETIMNLCGGSRVNETIGRIISSLIAQKRGESVGLYSDAYRIVLEASPPVSSTEAEKMLYSLSEYDDLGYLLYAVLKHSRLITKDLIFAGKKFGALKKRFELQSFRFLEKLFMDTIIMREAVNRHVSKRMDVKNSLNVLHGIRDGGIGVVCQKLSSFSQEGDFFKKFLIPSEDEGVLKVLEERLNNTRVNLLCMSCGYERGTRVERISNTDCPRCKAKMVGIYNRNREDAKKSAPLVASYGKRAVLILSGRGIGPRVASRILMLQLKGKPLLKEILKEEIKYARTRAFWKD